MQPPQQTDLPGAIGLGTFCAQDELEKEFTDELRDILEVIAWTGNYWHEWSMLKCLLSFRLKQVLTQYNESRIAAGGARQALVTGETFSELLRRLDEGLDLFVDGPPFTLQRLCEVLLNPQITYPNIDKVALAFEKLLLVTSTVPICKDPYPSFPDSKEHSCEQTAQPQQSVEGAKENGVPEGRPMIDEEMTDVIIADDKPSEADKVPIDEASQSLKNKLSSLASEDSQNALPDSGKVHMNSEAPLVDEDLVDIALDDQRALMGV